MPRFDGAIVSLKWKAAILRRFRVQFEYFRVRQHDSQRPRAADRDVLSACRFRRPENHLLAGKLMGNAQYYEVDSGPDRRRSGPPMHFILDLVRIT